MTDLDTLRDACRLAFDRWLDDDGSLDDVVKARKALRDAKAKPKPYPTDIGGWYLLDGSVAVVYRGTKPDDNLYARTEYGVEYAMEEIGWALDETGAAIRVPALRGQP